MKVSEMFESKWLTKADLDDPIGGDTLTIRKVTEELVGADQQSKWALNWRERDVPPMLCNKTNLRLLASMFGDDTDEWSGKEVEVYHDPSVSYQGQLVGGLRVRPPRPPKPKSRRSESEKFQDDDVSF